MPELKAPICRFNDSNNLADHSTHHHPFATLGPLESHIQPQFVVVNTGQKLFARSLNEFFRFPSVLKQIASHKSDDQADSRLATIAKLHRHWTQLVIPDDFVARSCPRSGPSDDTDNDDQDQDQDHAEEGQEEPKEPKEPEEESEEEESNADSDKLQSTPSKKSNVGRQLHNVASTSRSGSLNTAVDTDGWCPSEDTAWVEGINDWTMKCCDAAASEGGWESSILNEGDQVLVAYAKEKP